ENLARSGPYFFQERGFFICTIPMTCHGYGAPIGKAESGNINGVRGCMLAVIPLIGIIDTPTTIAAIGDNLFDFCAEIFECSGAQYLPLPEHKCCRNRAAYSGGRTINHALPVF